VIHKTWKDEDRALWAEDADLRTKGQQMDARHLELSERLLVEGAKLEKAVMEYFAM